MRPATLPENPSDAGREHARVRLDREHVVRGLVRVFGAVGRGAVHAVLFVRPQHQPHGAARPDAELLHEAQRLPRHDAAGAVVRSTGAHVPRVEVAADEHHLLRPLAADDLADHVRRRHLAFHAPARDEPHAHAPAGVGEPHDPVGVLGGHGRRRNLRLPRRVGHAAGVRRPQPERPHRPHQHRGRAVLGGQASARRSGTTSSPNRSCR